MHLSRYDWLQFFVLYYMSCAVECIERSNDNKKKNLLKMCDRLSDLFINNKPN